MREVRALSRVGETAVLRKLRPDHRAGRRAATLLSVASRDGALWAGVTAASLVHRTTRRAGRDGAVGWLAASGVAFAVKQVADRRRPQLLPALGPSTHSSSMPSSHTAGAIAYATAATLRLPPMGVVLVPVASAVAWSRAATARHFATDVAVGGLIGAGAGFAVHRLVRRLDRPGDVAPSTAEPDRDATPPLARSDAS